MIFKFAARENIKSDTIDALKAYLHDADGIGWKELFPHHSPVRVEATHPFARINAAKIAGQAEPAGLFPSVTVSVTSETDAEQLLAFSNQVATVTEAIIQGWIGLEAHQRLLSKARLQQLLAAAQGKGGQVFAEVKTRHFTQQVAFSVWSENDAVSDSLYYATKAFIEQNLETFSDAGMENLALSGSPNGIYSVDTGRVLYGGELMLSGTNRTEAYYIDTEWTQSTVIKHSAANNDIQNVDWNP